MRHLLTIITAIAAALPAVASDAVPFPEGYRDWHHVKSMVIEEGHPLFAAFGGIHHVYANPEAIEGYKSGKFPDGAVIVFDLLDASRTDNAIIEGTRKVAGVMQKDATRFSDTGGWGFEGFAEGDAGKRIVDDPKTACFNCHAPQKDRDYVFSSLRD